jgi:recombinational DNA repair protein (RecF pathway)
MERECIGCKKAYEASPFSNYRNSLCGECSRMAKKRRDLRAGRRYRDDNRESERARSKRNMGAKKSTPDPFKARARRLLREAILAGTVEKPALCVSCGWEGVLHGHHADYNKPLAVEWLCSICHGLRHRQEIDPGPNGFSPLTKLKLCSACWRYKCTCARAALRDTVPAEEPNPPVDLMAALKEALAKRVQTAPDEEPKP